MAKTNSNNLKRGRKVAGSGEFDIRDNGTFPMVPPDAIEIIERSEDNLFYNPRSLASFDPERMASLQQKIQIDGLQQPPIVRTVSEKGKVVAVQLIAGERRLRSILGLIEQDVPCYDNSIPIPKVYKRGDVVVYQRRLGSVSKQDGKTVHIELWEEGSGDTHLDTEEVEANFGDVMPTLPSSELFSHIPTKMYEDISDERCISLAFSENDDSQPLTIEEEIALVERLTQRGYKQVKIAEMVLGKKHKTNVTWVSQTANFRNDLPKRAFNKLLDGTLKRNVAVRLLSYPADQRSKVFQEAVKVEKEEHKAVVQELETTAQDLQDEAEALHAQAEDAAMSGNNQKAASLTKKAESAEGKSDKASEKAKKKKKEGGSIRQGHIDAAASRTGAKTRRAKMLPKAQIEEIQKHLAKATKKGGKCPVTENDLPPELVTVASYVIEGIMTGERDWTAPIRRYMIEQGQWTPPDDSDEPSMSAVDVADKEELDELGDSMGLSDDDYEDSGWTDEEEHEADEYEDDDYDERDAFDSQFNSMVDEFD